MFFKRTAGYDAAVFSFAKLDSSSRHRRRRGDPIADSHTSRTKKTNMNSTSLPIASTDTATAVPKRFVQFIARAALAVMLAAVFVSPSANGQDDAPSDENRGYLVQPGDLLHISVWGEAGLDQDVLVRPDGGFSFPLAGDLSAVGKTVEELRVEITERLARYIPGSVVTVAVRAINGNKIYVLGQVNNPGEFVMNPRIDVMQALSIAGGTTAFASTNGIFVLRRQNGRQVALSFRLDDVVRGRNLDQNILLESGDVVVVP